MPAGIEPAYGNAGDAAFCSEAVAGAKVVYHCVNPAYSARAWADQLPVIQSNLSAAAGAAGARLVVLDNLYAVGTGEGRPINEETPADPQSKKGEIRARLADDLFAAHERGDVRVVAGRASDFYGPRGFETHFGKLFWGNALKGKPVGFLPDPSTPHSYHYVPDVAEGLIQLGLGPDDVCGRPWMLPCSPAEPTTALVQRFSRHLGRDIKLRRMPKPILKVVGRFVPILRELDEMLHQWEQPFVVDDSQFRVRFGSRSTDNDTAAAATVDWAKAAFAH
jgi:nucleoside-diphosphate-sugar epimerase